MGRLGADDDRQRASARDAGSRRQRPPLNFGWRQIVRSTDPAAPIATYVAPNGTRIESFNDAVDPKRIYDALLTGTLRGGEGPFTTIRFDIRPDQHLRHQCSRSQRRLGKLSRALLHLVHQPGSPRRRRASSTSTATPGACTTPTSPSRILGSRPTWRRAADGRPAPAYVIDVGPERDDRRGLPPALRVGVRGGVAAGQPGDPSGQPGRGAEGVPVRAFLQAPGPLRLRLRHRPPRPCCTSAISRARPPSRAASWSAVRP